MTIALLVSLACTTLSGMTLLAVEECKGPFAVSAPHALVTAMLTGYTQRDE